MTPLLSNWTIVLVGRWNIEILNPEWVAEHLFGVEVSDVELVLDGMTTKLRYKLENMVFVPKTDRVTFSVLDEQDASLERIEKAACALMERLPVTPISAVGVNFTFLESNPTAELAQMFDFNDSSRLSDASYKVVKTAVRREIAYEDRVINFLATLSDPHVRLALNYHAEERDMAHAIERLKGRAVRFKNHSIGFLERLYGLAFEGGK